MLATDFLRTAAIATGSIIELTLMIKFRLLNLKAQKLKGTGRVHEIQAVRRFISFMKILLLAIPFSIILLFIDFEL